MQSQIFRTLNSNIFRKRIFQKTILACLSGAQMGSIHEKNRGRKSRDTAPLQQGQVVSVVLFHAQLYLVTKWRGDDVCRLPSRDYDDVVLVGEEDAPFGALAGLPGSQASICWKTEMYPIGWNLTVFDAYKPGLWWGRPVAIFREENIINKCFHLILICPVHCRFTNRIFKDSQKAPFSLNCFQTLQIVTFRWLN